jgi:hypothetical protein
MTKIFTTKKGTEIPLMNLKGKDYMMVAYRIQWFTEEVPRFKINTQFLVLTDEQTVCKATIEVLDETGNVVRRAEGTKRETKKDFSDHTEKAETGSLGRALIELGYGTQFALSDMDEGMRLADSPLQAVPKAAMSVPVSTTTAKKVEEAINATSKVVPSTTTVTEGSVASVNMEQSKPVSKFAPKAKVPRVTVAPANNDDWA